MNSVAIGLAGALALAMLLAPEPIMAAADQTKVVQDRDAAYFDAVKQHDGQRIRDIVADEFELVDGGGTTFTRDDLLKRTQANAIVYEHLDVSHKQLHPLGERTFVITGLLSVEGHNSVDGKSFSCALRYSSVYVRFGDWRLAFSQTTKPQSNDCPYP